MKICLVFRGENERNYRGYTCSLDNIDNWRKYIFDDLNKNSYDIVFITYKTTILNDLIKKINPIITITSDYENSSQVSNFKLVNDFINRERENYDRFIILRFDVIYKIKISEWNIWNKFGIIFPNKDTSWNTTKFYNDLIIILDKKSIDIFNDAVDYMININNTPIEKRISHHQAMPHHLGQYLYINNLEFYEMFYEIYDGVKNHPLYNVCGT